MNTRISKIAYYLPEKVITNKDLLSEFPSWDEEKVSKRIGIQQRHVCVDDQTALDMAVEVGNKVLQGFDREEIDFLILCTQSPDYVLPTSACIIQDCLGLSTSVGAYDFNLGCSGYIYGLAMAKGLIAGEIARHVLLITSETYSKHIHPQDIANRAIFGDGASATIISSSGESNIGDFVLKTDGNGYKELIVETGGARKRPVSNPPLLSYGTDNKYTCNHLYMNGPEIFNFTIENIPVLVKETLGKNKLTIEEVDYFIFHQANAFMLDFLRKKIKIPKDKFHIELTDTANTVSSTIPIGLKQAMDKGVIKEGSKVLLAGFGVGLSWGATVITV